MIASTAIVREGVRLQPDAVIEDFCVVGEGQVTDSAVEETTIGFDAHLRTHTVIYAGCQIGDGFRTGNKANIRELCSIGDNVSVGSLSVIEHHVTLESGVRIHSQAFVPEFSVLKARAWLGPQSVLTNSRFPLSPGAKENLEGPVLEEDCKVGANVTILPGVRIGTASLVGAGSVVTKDVPDYAVVIGSPARVVGDVRELKEYR